MLHTLTKGNLKLFHFSCKISIKIADFFFKILIIQQILINLINIVHEHLNCLIRRTQAALGVFRKLADLLCHHGEAAACLTGTGSLNGGIEGEEVNLGGNLINHLHYTVNLLGALGKHIQFRGNLTVAGNHLGKKLLLITDAARNLTDCALDHLHIIRYAIDGSDNPRQLGMIVIEHADKVVLELFRGLLPGNDTPVKERITL